MGWKRIFECEGIVGEIMSYSGEVVFLSVEFENYPTRLQLLKI